MQDVSKVQQSQRSSNLYYDVALQMSETESKTVRVMHQRGDGNKRQLFLDKMVAEQPIKLSNMPISTSGIVFLNKGAVIEDVPPHVLQFQYRQLQTKEITAIKDLKNFSTGTFMVSGLIRWSGPPQKPKEESAKIVRDGTITDSTGSIKISVWEEHIEQIEEGEFYTITECKLRFYYGKCISTSKTTTVAKAPKQTVIDVPKTNQAIVCCPEIMNVSINMYPVCNNRECKKKINGNPGTQLVKCLSCNRSMLVKNCYLDMNVNFQLQKEEKTMSVTAFGRVLAAFLNEDVYEYRDDVDNLIEKLLMLESTDFYLSENGRLVTKMQSH